MHYNKSIIRCISFLAIIIAFASFVSAQDLPFDTTFEEDLVEGESIKGTFIELDKMIFTYMGENHTFRLMSINTVKCDIIVDKKGIEIHEGTTESFALMPGSFDDLNVTLKSIGDGAATFRFRLSSKFIEDDSSDDDANTTNSSSTNSTVTNSTDNSTDDDDSNTDDNSNTQSNDNTQNTDTSNNQTSPQQNATQNPISASSSPTGDTVVNINFNITLPEGSGVGLLIVIAIVLGGLLAYKKVKKRIESGHKIYTRKKKKR